DERRRAESRRTAPRSSEQVLFKRTKIRLVLCPRNGWTIASGEKPPEMRQKDFCLVGPGLPACRRAFARRLGDVCNSMDAGRKPGGRPEGLAPQGLVVFMPKIGCPAICPVIYWTLH